ncbi:APC family permease [Alicyclobacillus shizuokensis]|uniref:APC family permease n=1 Tax=Alicyclobacillus shizuokensis TaxID=392014 RepID=UPI0008355C6A|nr:APC family permease [Alicyclobacillus shizuokensis]
MEHGLRRTLTLYPLVLFGLAYMAPMIVFGTFGVMDQTTHGSAVTAYIIASVAMLFTAYSYGRMAKAYPISGSAYTYVRRTMGSHLGFVIGWVTLLDYFFLPMVIWLIGGVYLNAVLPGVPTWIWIVLFIVVTTIINVVGIRVSTNVNLLLMMFQFLVIAIFLALSIRDVAHGMGAGRLLSAQPFVNPHVQFGFIMAGASIACYSFLGFDAVTTMTEETIRPEPTVPRAIMLIVLIGGVIFIAATYFTQLVYPDYTKFANADAGAVEIARQIGGNLFTAVFTAGLIIAQLSSGISAQASAARLLYAMGRDKVLPRRFFGRIHARFRTPDLNILLVGLFGLLALFFSVETSTSFINFGAFTAFAFVNLAVIVHYFVQQRLRGGWGAILYGLLPLIGFGFDAWLWLNLDRNAMILGAIWLVVGLIYLTVLTRGFRVAPPEMRLDDWTAMDG